MQLMCSLLLGMGASASECSSTFDKLFNSIQKLYESAFCSSGVHILYAESRNVLFFIKIVLKINCSYVFYGK